MLDDQKVLGSIATALSDRLAYFRRLDQAQRVLSRPGEAEIVNSHEFLPMIERLDLCLEFMKSNVGPYIPPKSYHPQIIQLITIFLWCSNNFIHSDISRMQIYIWSAFNNV